MLEHQLGQRLEVGVLGDQRRRAVFVLGDLAAPAIEPAGDERAVGRDPEHRLALGLVAQLPGQPITVGVDVEVGGDPEVALAAGRELDLAAHPRHAVRLAPRLLLRHLEVVADHVPDAVQLEQAVGVDLPLAALAAAQRAVAEPHRSLLRDRELELGQALRDLRRVHAAQQVDAHGVRPRVGGDVAAEREVLQREPQRLCVGELAVQHAQAVEQRGQLLVVEVDRRQEVLLLAQRVELLAGELVAARGDGHAKALELCPVRVVAARERFVAHVRVALDVVLDVSCGDRTLLRHQVRHQRELADELVGVVRQG